MSDEQTIQTQEQKTPFDPAAFIKSASGKENEVEEITQEPKESPVEPPATETGGKAQSAEPPAFQLDEYWTTLSSELGEEFQVPEPLKTGKKEDGTPITAKEKLMMLRDIMFEVSQFGNDDDDAFVRDYMTASSQENFNRKEWLKQRVDEADLLSLSNRDFMRKILEYESKQNKYDWSSDDIEQKLNSMNKIDLDIQANERKNSIRSYQQKAVTEKNAEVLQSQTKKLETLNTEIKTKTNDFIQSIQGKRNIGGFELGEPEIKSFSEELPSFLEKKVVELPDGKRIFASKADSVLVDILGSPEKSYGFAVYLYLVSKGKLEGFMSEKVEDKKRKIEERLDDEPQDTTGKGLSGKPGFDRAAFIRATKGQGS